MQLAVQGVLFAAPFQIVHRLLGAFLLFLVCMCTCGHLVTLLAPSSKVIKSFSVLFSDNFHYHIIAWPRS